MGDLAKEIDGKKTVLVTGFGPFKSHEVNASWVAVRELSKMGLDREDCNLVVREIPVTYHAVKNEVPRLWQQLRPHLVVHVGVSSIAQDLTLEQLAHNDGYVKVDAAGKLNHCSYCCKNGPPNITSELRMDLVCHSVNQSECGVIAVLSTDPGRYLCDFIYYTSLHQDKSKVAFIHVPPLNSPYTAEELAVGIQKAIHAMLEQLDNNHRQI